MSAKTGSLVIVAADNALESTGAIVKLLGPAGTVLLPPGASTVRRRLMVHLANAPLKEVLRTDFETGPVLFRLRAKVSEALC